MINSFLQIEIVYYAAGVFLFEKVILLMYGLFAAKQPKFLNWVLFGYWEGFGIAVPVILLSWRVHINSLTIIDAVLIAFIVLYYGCFKVRRAHQNSIVAW